jgi:hypothetical protein
MEAPGGVEPPTNGLGNRCSIQLSYGAAMPNYRTRVFARSSPAATVSVPSNQHLECRRGCGYGKIADPQAQMPGGTRKLQSWLLSLAKHVNRSL